LTGIRSKHYQVQWQAQFVLLAAIWGTSFAFIKVLGRRWPALDVSLGRCVLGALTLLVLLRLSGESLRFERRLWMHLTIAAVLFNAGPFTLYAFGETKVSSVLAGLWNATTPLFALLAVLAAFPEEHPDRSRIIGLGIGFAGAGLVLGPWRSLGSNQLVGDLACAGAAACYGLGFPYVRRYLAGRPESGVALAAGQLLCASLILAVLAPLAGVPTVHIGLDGVGSLLALGALGSGIAYLLNFSIVRAAGSTTASTVTYLIPVFSTISGVALLGESLHWNEPIGAAVLIAGIAISQGTLRSRRARSAGARVG
jgi:drug/metabolite transporter (DMT)-like permease